MTDLMETPKSSTNNAELTLCLQPPIAMVCTDRPSHISTSCSSEFIWSETFKSSQHNYVNTVAVWHLHRNCRPPRFKWVLSRCWDAEGVRSYTARVTWHLHLWSPAMATDDEWPTVNASEGALARSPRSVTWDVPCWVCLIHLANDERGFYCYAKIRASQTVCTLRNTNNRRGWRDGKGDKGFRDDYLSSTTRQLLNLQLQLQRYLLWKVFRMLAFLFH